MKLVIVCKNKLFSRSRHRIRGQVASSASTTRRVRLDLADATAVPRSPAGFTIFCAYKYPRLRAHRRPAARVHRPDRRINAQRMDTQRRRQVKRTGACSDQTIGFGDKGHQLSEGQPPRQVGHKRILRQQRRQQRSLRRRPADKNFEPLSRQPADQPPVNFPAPTRGRYRGILDVGSG